MTRKFNFGAGPATMPEAVLEEVQQELLDWKGLGLSIMEISHRSPEFVEIANQAESDFRDLLDISDNYAVLFLHGGATLQNAMIPLNLSAEGGTADYIYTGHWANRSISEAKKYINVNIAASSEDKDFTYFPKQSSWSVSKNSAYLHITPNETIGGLRFKDLKDSEVPIVADYSSAIFPKLLK